MRRMSKRVCAILIVLLAITVLGSCNWMLSPFNHMEIDGTRHRLDDLYWLDFGQYEGYYEVGLVMVSDDIQVVGANDYRGVGEQLTVILASRSSDLDNGIYRYGTSPADFTLWGGLAAVNVDYDRQDVDDVYFITGGTVDLRKTLGDGYVLQFELRAIDIFTERTVTIEGRFRGSVEDSFRSDDPDFSRYPTERRFDFSW